MLRIFRRSIWTGGAHKVATTNPRVPSVKTTIKLNNLPASITQQSLRNHFKSTSNIRSIDIEPGCVVYFRNEADADIFKKQLLSKTKYEIRISSVFIPSLLISHVPFDVISSNISDQLPVGTPQLIKHIGGSLIQINVRGSEHVITIVEALKSLHAELKISSLDVDVVKLPSGSFVISLPVLISLSDAKLNEMQSLIAKSVPLESLESFKVDKGARSVLVRLTGNVKDADAIVKEALPGVPFKIAPLARPAVIVRKLDQFAPEDVQGILGSVGATRVQYLSRGRDLVPNTAVLYFNSETDALEALKKIDSEELPVALAEVDEDLDDIDETGELGEVDVDDEEELIRAGEGEGEGIEGAENEGVEAIGDEAMEGEMTDELMEQGDDEDFIMEKIPASYRLFEEPGVCISNVAKCRLTLSELTELLSPHEASDVSVEGDKCYAVLPSKKHVDLLLSSLPRQTFNGTKLIAEQHNRVDTGIEIQLADTDLQSISRAFQNVAGLVVASIAEITNKSISFGYLTRNDVETAKFSFLKQRISLGPQGSAPISADVSAVPAFAVEVSGLGVETSVSKLLESIPSKTDPIKVDRTAIIKVKRNQDVLPTLKKLKSTSIDGFKLSPVRYRGFSGEVSANRTEYDEFSDESDEIFDKFALRKLLKDYLHADPAIRYQIAKNFFERTVTDAQGSKDIDSLLDGSFTTAAREEARHILSKDLTESSSNRLFTLFLQRDDMNSFLDEFQELQSALGNPNVEDKFNWSRFSMATPDDEYELEEQVKLEEFYEKNKEQLALSSKIRQYMETDDDKNDEGNDENEDRDVDMNSKNVEVDDDRDRDVERGHDEQEDDDDEDEDDAEMEKFRRIRVPDEEGIRQKKYAKRNVKIHQTDGNDIDLEDVDTLTDKDGHVWGGFVVETDVVQKVTPGNRIMRYRTLVVVGNLRGSCGFGVGKAEEIQMATKYAFRDALRNLYHIDLYDNFGLAHNLYGKHNSCHCYIIATPKDREMIANGTADSILNLFGISTASVKFKGRRNPFSVVRSMFNALEKHENIDETAKKRGLRYLTLRWAYQNKV